MFRDVASLMKAIDCACDILYDFCAENTQGADCLVGKYGGVTSQPSEIRAAASVKCLETEFPEATVIGSFSFAAPTSDAKKDETALIAFLREMDPVYTQNKHTEGGAGSSGLTTTVQPASPSSSDEGSGPAS